jgi:DNA-binding GntR family transcriptional regulator
MSGLHTNAAGSQVSGTMKRADANGPTVGGFARLDPQSLTDRIYTQFSERLMRGELKPHQRLRIRDLAQELGTSETPVREAVFQLVRENALELKPRHYVRVRKLSLSEYMEIRDIRLKLEPMAAQRALPHIDAAAIEELARLHDELVAAEANKEFDRAIQANFDFHFGLYRRSQMPGLIRILESLWIQVGPLLNFLYPYGHPTYDGLHQHVHVLNALRRRGETELVEAVRNDLIEGGRKFISHLYELEMKVRADGRQGSV